MQPGRFQFAMIFILLWPWPLVVTMKPCCYQVKIKVWSCLHHDQQLQPNQKFCIKRVFAHKLQPAKASLLCKAKRVKNMERMYFETKNAADSEDALIGSATTHNQQLRPNQKFSIERVSAHNFHHQKFHCFVKPRESKTWKECTFETRMQPIVRMHCGRWCYHRRSCSNAERLCMARLTDHCTRFVNWCTSGYQA